MLSAILADLPVGFGEGPGLCSLEFGYSPPGELPHTQPHGAAAAGGRVALRGPGLHPARPQAGPIPWHLFYSSAKESEDRGFGYGRRASFPLRLKQMGTGAVVTVSVDRETGGQCYYVDDGSGFEPITPGGHDTLVKNLDGSWDETRLQTGATFHYPAGTLVSLAYTRTSAGSASP